MEDALSIVRELNDESGGFHIYISGIDAMKKYFININYPGKNYSKYNLYKGFGSENYEEILADDLGYIISDFKDEFYELTNTYKKIEFIRDEIVKSDQRNYIETMRKVIEDIRKFIAEHDYDNLHFDFLKDFIFKIERYNFSISFIIEQFTKQLEITPYSIFFKDVDNIYDDYQKNIRKIASQKQFIIQTGSEMFEIMDRVLTADPLFGNSILIFKPMQGSQVRKIDCKFKEYLGPEFNSLALDIPIFDNGDYVPLSYLYWENIKCKYAYKYNLDMSDRDIENILKIPEISMRNSIIEDALRVSYKVESLDIIPFVNKMIQTAKIMGQHMRYEMRILGSEVLKTFGVRSYDSYSVEIRLGVNYSDIELVTQNIYEMLLNTWDIKESNIKIISGLRKRKIVGGTFFDVVEHRSLLIDDDKIITIYFDNSIIEDKIYDSIIDIIDYYNYIVYNRDFLKAQVEINGVKKFIDKSLAFTKIREGENVVPMEKVEVYRYKFDSRKILTDLILKLDSLTKII